DGAGAGTRTGTDRDRPFALAVQRRVAAHGPDVEVAHVISGGQAELPAIGFDPAAERVTEVEIEITISGEGTELEAVAEAIVDTQQCRPIVGVVGDEVVVTVQVLPIVGAEDPETRTLFSFGAGRDTANIDR